MRQQEQQNQDTPIRQQQDPDQGAPSNAAGQDQQDKGNMHRREHRKRIVIIAAVVLATVGLGIGIYYYIYKLSHTTTDDAFITGDITNIAPRVMGHVKEVYVQDNQWVEAGQVLL